MPEAAQQAALWTQVILYGAAAAIIAAVGTLAAVKCQLFRRTRPFLNISLDVSSGPCSPEHTHIGVAAELHNASPATAKVDTMLWQCWTLGDYDDAAVEAHLAANQASGNSDRQDDTQPGFP